MKGSHLSKWSHYQVLTMPGMKQISLLSTFFYCSTPLNDAVDLLFPKNGRISRQGLRREVVVTVRAVQEGLAALAISCLVGMQDQTRTWGRLRV